jgi:hypothetical protein
MKTIGSADFDCPSALEEVSDFINKRSGFGDIGKKSLATGSDTNEGRGTTK